MSLAEREVGAAPVAEDLAKEAVRIVEEIGTGFVGVWAMGVLARVSQSPDDARVALQAGEQMLSSDGIFFCHLHYCRHAIEVCLEHEWWPLVAHHSDLLQAFSSSRPTPFADFFVARGRVLHALATNGSTKATVDELVRLRNDAEKAGLRAALSQLEKALVET